MQTTLLLDQPGLVSPCRARRFRFGAEERARISILNARGRSYEGGGDEPDLSLKWIPEGVADYVSEGTSFRLGGQSQLLLNRGQPYRLRMTRESAANKRLESAHDALLMTADPIAVIAQRAGYETRNTFDRAFQRRFRTTSGRVRLHGAAAG